MTCPTLLDTHQCPTDRTHAVGLSRVDVAQSADRYQHSGGILPLCFELI